MQEEIKTIVTALNELMRRGSKDRDRIYELEEALRKIAAPSKVIVKGEEAVVALRLLLSSHRRTALKALGEKE